MGKRTLKRSYSRAFSRSRSRSKSSRMYRPITKKAKRSNSFFRELGATAGELAGAALPFLGATRGRKIAKRMIESVWGRGDYYLGKAPTNTLHKLTDGTTPPTFGSGDRITTIQHREYLTDVVSSTTFRINQYEINPGIERTFPWLASVARNYECYRIKGMMFQFKSMSADALTSTNTALGTVIMATQYNAAADPFVSKQQMENYEFAQSCKPSESMMHYIECAKRQTPISELYVRTGEIPQYQPQQLYDIGDFYIATQGMQQQDVIIGELWVTYDIELFKPKLIPVDIGIGSQFWSMWASNTSQNGIFGITNSRSFSPGNTFNPNIVGNAFEFPKLWNSGVFRCRYYLFGDTISTTGSLPGRPDTLIGCVLLDAYPVSSSSSVYSDNYFADDTGAVRMAEFVIKITDFDATFAYTGGNSGYRTSQGIQWEIQQLGMDYPES